MTEDAPSPWWSIPQAVVWIVTRSDAQVLRASKVRMLADVTRMAGLRPTSSPKEPPVSAEAARDDLRPAWPSPHIALRRRGRGTRPSRSGPLDPRFRNQMQPRNGRNESPYLNSLQ